jgi:hypothetical protein
MQESDYCGVCGAAPATEVADEGLAQCERCAARWSGVQEAERDRALADLDRAVQQAADVLDAEPIRPRVSAAVLTLEDPTTTENLMDKPTEQQMKRAMAEVA